MIRGCCLNLKEKRCNIQLSANHLSIAEQRSCSMETVNNINVSNIEHVLYVFIVS
jgi:hypothetical protein